MKKLIQIQNELKVPKGNVNKFGNYKYRSAEDILEAVKPILLKHECLLTLTDSIQAIGTKLYLVATATIQNEDTALSVTGFAELSEHKGMSAEQCTGTASSYARKYALNGLFLIDETEADADSNNVAQPASKPQAKPFLERGTIDFTNVTNALLQGKANIEDVKKKFQLLEPMENELVNLKVKK
jgi:hypothetical protein